LNADRTHVLGLSPLSPPGEGENAARDRCPGPELLPADRDLGARRRLAPARPPSEGPAPGKSTPSPRHQAGGGQPGEAGGQATPAATPLPEETNGVLTDPIDTRYLTRVPFGSSSFWLQPWRAYFDTWPASTLTSSLGINFNVAPADAEAVAQLL